MGTADMIVPYPENINKRQLNRRIASKLFTAAVRQISGIKLKYFNGSVLHRTELINSIKIKTNSYAYQAEALTKLINQGFSYKEVPMTVNYNQHSSNAFKIRNFLGIVKFFIFLVGNSFTKKYVKKTTKAQ